MQSEGFTDEIAVVDAAVDLLERRQQLRALLQEGIDAADQGELVEMDEALRVARARIAEIAAHQTVKSA
jgi:predicted transcriptional regulator